MRIVMGRMPKFRRINNAYRVLYDVYDYRHTSLYSYTKRTLSVYHYLYRSIVDSK